MSETSAVELVVRVYDDGGVELSVPPEASGERMVDVLRAAGTALTDAADRREREAAPIACSTCGEPVVAVVAPVTGASRLQPCGHAAG